MLNYRVIMRSSCCPRLDNSRFDLKVKMLPTGYHGNIEESHFTIAYKWRGNNAYLVIINLESLDIAGEVLKALRKRTDIDRSKQWVSLDAQGEIKTHE